MDQPVNQKVIDLGNAFRTSVMRYAYFSDDRTAAEAAEACGLSKQNPLVVSFGEASYLRGALITTTMEWFKKEATMLVKIVAAEEVFRSALKSGVIVYKDGP